MRFSTNAQVAVLASALPLAFAQTFSDCNPTQRSGCPADPGLNAPSFKTDFTGGAGAATSWSAAGGTYLKYGSQGAEFTINQYGNAPTIQTDFYFLFGRVDVKMKAAPGVGVISSIVLESDTLDEVDFEFVGGDTSHVQTNYFGKGNTTTYDRVLYIPVSSPQTEFHTYTIDWTAERIQYIIDGTIVRTLNYQDAVGGKNFPQTPMRVKLGNWTPPTNAPGTITWAGGPVNWAQAPFTMYVESVSVQNYNPAGSYVYGDTSGSWQSIQINGKSSASNGGSNSVAVSSSSAVGTGSAVSSVPATATRAPTSNLSVNPVQQTQVAASNTVVASFVTTSVATGVRTVLTSYTATARNNYTATTTSVSQQTNTNAAVALSHSLPAASLLGLLASFFML